MKKLKFTSILTLVILVLNFSAYAKIYDVVETSTISDGVTLKNIKRLDASGWLNINIAEADLSKDYLDIKLLKNKNDISKLINVKNLANDYNTEVAINGDFFSWYSKDRTKGSAVGVEINDGNLISSPADKSSQFAIFAKDAENDLFAGYLDCYMTVTAPNGQGEKVKAINKYDDMAEIVMYNRKWGEKSVGSAGNLVEVVVKNNVVESINFDKGPVEIPEDGYVLSFLQDHTRFMLDNFKVGDPIAFDVSYKPNFNNIKFAVGGGTMLVKDGKKAAITHNIAGNNPRTAIGTSADGKKVYLITVDGRQTSSIGVSLSYLADILIEYGVHNAINLDGGGSTTMAAKSFADDAINVVNSPSESSLRAVSNGVGIVNTMPKGELDSFVLKTEFDKVFIHSSIRIETIGVDKYLRKNSGFNEGDIKYTVSDDNGYIKDGFYHPSKEGKVTIKAKYNDVIGEKELEVLPMPDMLYTNDKTISMNAGQTKYLNLKGVLNDGRNVPINLSDCGISSTNNIFEISGNNIVAKSKGSAVITFGYGDVKTSVLLNIDTTSSEKIPDDVKKADPKNIAADKSGSETFSFSVFGNTTSRNTLLEWVSYQKMMDKIEADGNSFAVFAGEKTSGASDTMRVVNTSSGTTSFDVKNSRFIVFDNKTSVLSKSDLALLSEKTKNLVGDNVFVILTKKLKMNDSEMKVFNGILNDNCVKNGKNVSVIYNGEYNITPLDGIEYFSLSGFEAMKSVPDALSMYYTEFTVDGKNITYQTKYLYK